MRDLKVVVSFTLTPYYVMTTSLSDATILTPYLWASSEESVCFLGGTVAFVFFRLFFVGLSGPW